MTERETLSFSEPIWSGLVNQSIKNLVLWVSFIKHETLSETIFVSGTWVSDVSVLLLVLLNRPSLKTSGRLT
jgi:hypothetical protein